MADESILTPGYGDEEDNSTVEEQTTLYLIKDNYLSEFDSESEKSVVRENLNIYPKDSLYTKEEVSTLLLLYINEAINNYLQMDDPHGILPQVEEMIEGMVKQDGSTPFTSALSGQTPYKDEHLTTKKYVDLKIQDHVNADDPHGTLDVVTSLLNSYVKTSDIYDKSLLYTQSEVDKLLKSYVKLDGSTPFKSALIGVDPTIDSHLATKRYADKILYNHMIEVDPHHFITILNLRLASYAKSSNVYNKTETYSRTLLDSIINSVVQDFVDLAINDYLNEINNSISELKTDYVKRDGTTSFTAPQSGVDAISEDHLVTLRLLNEFSPEWLTSGPVEATVGKVEEGTEFPEVVTLQEIMDAIFYGSTVTISVDEYVNIGEKATITLCIHGSLSLFETADLYENGEVIYTFSKEDFENGCVTVEGNTIYEDTEYKFIVEYTKGIERSASATVKVSYPTFIGLLPKWKTANTVTYDYLVELSLTDSTNNKFYTFGDNVSEITHQYEFEGTDLYHLFLVIPESYPDLYQMKIPSQQFGEDAFDIIDSIPLIIQNVNLDIIYKMYVYKQALVALNQQVTFTFQ